VIEVDNPLALPDPPTSRRSKSPSSPATILSTEEYVGGILKLVEEKRGRQKNFEYVSSTR